MESGAKVFDEFQKRLAHESFVATLVSLKPLAIVVPLERSKKCKQLGREV